MTSNSYTAFCCWWLYVGNYV